MHWQNTILTLHKTQFLPLSQSSPRIEYSGEEHGGSFSEKQLLIEPNSLLTKTIPVSSLLQLSSPFLLPEGHHSKYAFINLNHFNDIEP